MSRFRRWFGLDPFEFLIHLGVTLSVMAVGATIWEQTDAIVMLATVSGASLLILDFRRRRALKQQPPEPVDEMAAERIADLEARLAELERVENRVLELEERVDFTERLLAGQREQSQLPR